MGREVRKVPADWRHPKDEGTGKFVPLMDGKDYARRRANWLDSLAKNGLQDTIENEGNPPDLNEYMPLWLDDVRTHYMMYEDTSEGTPISPAFATPEELARWLVDNNASALGRSTGSYEGWLRVANGGFAPSMVMSSAGLQSGVDAL